MNFLDNVTLHNVEDIEEVLGGYKLSRYPKKVLSEINESARHMSRYSCGMEIRFVAKAKTVYVTVTPLFSGGDVTIMYGDYTVSVRQLSAGKTETLILSEPASVTALDDDFYKNNRFGRNVWRLHFHNSMIVVNSIDGMGDEIRPPKKEELPKKTMLAYGSSITHGAGTILNSACYAETFATLMGADIINKGVGGSCFLEPELADTFTKEIEWDFALLELGVNMTDRFTPEQFDERCTYFLKTFAATGKTIILPTIFPNTSLYNPNLEKVRDTAAEFMRILRREAAKYDNCYIIEGDKVLTTTEYLTADGIHPCTEGHMFMGINLYNEVKKQNINI